MRRVPCYGHCRVPEIRLIREMPGLAEAALTEAQT